MRQYFYQRCGITFGAGEITALLQKFVREKIVCNFVILSLFCDLYLRPWLSSAKNSLSLVLMHGDDRAVGSNVPLYRKTIMKGNVILVASESITVRLFALPFQQSFELFQHSLHTPVGIAGRHWADCCVLRCRKSASTLLLGQLR